MGCLGSTILYSGWDLQTALAIQTLARYINLEMVLSALTALENDYELYSAIVLGFGVQSVMFRVPQYNADLCANCAMICGLRTVCLHCGTKRKILIATQSFALQEKHGDIITRGIPTSRLHIGSHKLQSNIEHLERERFRAVSV